MGQKHLRSAHVTSYLLGRLAGLTGERSLRANLALLKTCSNCGRIGEVAEGCRCWKENQMVTALQSPITMEVLRARRDEILAIARQYGASNVRVFGSVAKGGTTSESDVDFLVTFSKEVSLLVRIGLTQALEDRLGASVDVLTERGLHPLLRDEILRTAVPL